LQKNIQSDQWVMYTNDAIEIYESDKESQQYWLICMITANQTPTYLHRTQPQPQPQTQTHTKAPTTSTFKMVFACDNWLYSKDTRDRQHFPPSRLIDWSIDRLIDNIFHRLDSDILRICMKC
jgi:hypothetical protein